MNEYEKKTYSCYCLFDVCCLAKAKNESISELSERLKIFIKLKYEEMIKNGHCRCCHCKPIKLRSKGIWILREINHEYETDIIYVVCREYYSEKLKNIIIGEYHELKMNSMCSKKHLFSKSIGKFPCCYNYYLTGLLDCAYFCEGCKIFLCSLSDFQLKKIELVK